MKKDVINELIKVKNHSLLHSVIFNSTCNEVCEAFLLEDRTILCTFRDGFYPLGVKSKYLDVTDLINEYLKGGDRGFYASVLRSEAKEFYGF